MKDQKGDKSVEITVLVELFSTFFEKITFVHPDKEILIKNLSKFKNFLYGNQQNLEKGYEFLQSMKEQYQQYLIENQSTASASNQNGANLTSNNQLTNQGSTQQSFQQYQQQYNAQQRSQQEQQRQQIQQTTSSYQNPSIAAQNNTVKTFKFDLSSLNENANLFKIQSIQDFSGVRGEEINPKIALSGSSFNYIREFVSEVNAFYRCIGFRYIEQLIKNQNLAKLQDILKSVQGKKIVLEQYYREQATIENDAEENIARQQNNDYLRNTFCGYLEYIIESLKKDKSSAELQEVLYKVVNGDSAFDTALISFIKEQSVRFIQESEPKYIEFLLSSKELKNVKELIQHIRSQDEPLEITIKIVALALEILINIYTIENNNVLTKKDYKFNSLPESSSITLDLLKIKQPYIIYYLIYNQLEGQQLVRVSSQAFISQQQSSYQQQEIQQINEQNIYGQKPRQQNNVQTNKINLAQNNTEVRPSQIEDLKVRGGYLKKMLKMFDDNTEDLINKLSSFKDGMNEDEEDEQDEENIEKVLKEQINYSKSRALNFYSNIQAQDRGQNWVSDGISNQ
ncbi:hypothetical protein ABPG72_021550 [Tetrahymena utriculariae]